ncbi:ankyrin repeat domain-containing protein [Herbaspirillum sp. RTI4]|uniref:ankyrin repeat domain-containing protein n=1 Tax=Herbaspirillum sp. RTI4 TaxID=3048640 RepID=UPI002AB41AF9|nr:ankyrin repeat domain-containing protein [Herbaspirillum sp. RTI4]MDY7579083.1 ankyrin repeat domain-containing protein [Herbaspirillum sp. RTI4]MEA9981338.1 ankyrin repeat domain-containing protein [Herbaspirillum sp. RTI4]
MPTPLLRTVLPLITILLSLLLPGSATAGSYDDYFKAVRLDDPATIKELMQRGLSPNMVEADRNETAMIVALREDSMKVFNLLLDTPGIDINAQAANGDDALMIASYKGNVVAVKALLAKDVEVNRPGWTPLHYAAASGNMEIVDLLLDASAYIDAESPNGTTPLMMATRNGKDKTVELLLKEGADASLKNALGMTAADFAEKFEFKGIAAILLKHQQAFQK